MDKKRVVITGMGIVSPLGNDLDTFWRNLEEGNSGIDFVTRFDVSNMPTKVAAEVKDFDPSQWLERKEIRHMDRFVHFAMATAMMALADAQLELEELDKKRCSVIVGTGVGGVTTLEEQKEVLMKKGPGRVSPFFVPMMISNMAAGHISIAFGFQGTSHAVVTACASATNAIGEAMRLVEHGYADVVLCGGTEAPIVPLAFAGFCAMKAMSTETEKPQEACRPF